MIAAKKIKSFDYHYAIDFFYLTSEIISFLLKIKNRDWNFNFFCLKKKITFSGEREDREKVSLFGA